MEIVHNEYLIPGGGWWNPISKLPKQCLKTVVSCALPSNPTQTYVKSISKEQEAKTFHVLIPLRPLNGCPTLSPTIASIWVPSRAPTQSYKQTIIIKSIPICKIIQDFKQEF